MFTKTSGLTWQHWVYSILMGAIAMPLGALLRCVPVRDRPSDYAQFFQAQFYAAMNERHAGEIENGLGFFQQQHHLPVPAEEGGGGAGAFGHGGHITTTTAIPSSTASSSSSFSSRSNRVGPAPTSRHSTAAAAAAAGATRASSARGSRTSSVQPLTSVTAVDGPSQQQQRQPSGSYHGRQALAQSQQPDVHQLNDSSRDAATPAVPFKPAGGGSSGSSVPPTPLGWLLDSHPGTPTAAAGGRRGGSSSRREIDGEGSAGYSASLLADPEGSASAADEATGVVAAVAPASGSGGTIGSEAGLLYNTNKSDNSDLGMF